MFCYVMHNADEGCICGRNITQFEADHLFHVSCVYIPVRAYQILPRFFRNSKSNVKYVNISLGPCFCFCELISVLTKIV